MDDLILREAEEVGCYGLVEGYAKNLHTGHRHYAGDSTKRNGPFFCPECFSDAVIRKCTVKRDHFAHKARLSPVLKREERELHLKCKEEICKVLQEKFPDGNWATERRIEAKNKPGVPIIIPDVSGRINGIAVAIEVQASSLTIPNLVSRSIAYKKWKIAVLWIVPLREELGNDPFRPRLYERYLHSMYFGRIFYWTFGSGTVLKPVHYSPAVRFIDISEWYDENGCQQQAGGYYKPYKSIKNPNYGPAIDIADFTKNMRGEFTPVNERLSIPECLIWNDNLDLWWDHDEENKFWAKHMDTVDESIAS